MFNGARPWFRSLFHDNKSKSWWRLSAIRSKLDIKPIANLFLIWAKDENIIKGFIIEKNSKIKGLETPKIEGKFALRASPTGMIQMDEVFVPMRTY